MAIWDTFKNNIINPTKNKLKEYNERFQTFKNENPRFKATWNFLTHPTMMRVYYIAGAIAMAPVTGGFSLVVAAKVGVAFATSLISIGAKAIQLRNFRELKLQQGLANAVVEKHAKLMSLRKGRESLFQILKKDKLLQNTHGVDSKIESKTMSFLKTIRDFGAENVAPIVMMGLTSPGAALGYVVGAVSGGLFISGEFAERAKLKHNAAHIKDTIRGACKVANIPPYKDSEELYETFKDKMVEYEAMQRMCKVFDDNPKMSSREIISEYNSIKQEVESTIKFGNIPPKPNLLRSFWHEVRPWGEKEMLYEIPEEKVISYHPPKFTKKSLNTQKSLNIQLGTLTPSVGRGIRKQEIERRKL